MLTVNDVLPEFSITGVKPYFNEPLENNMSAFDELNQHSFSGQWKIIYFYPKDFTFICPQEIIAFAKLLQEFEERNTIVLGGNQDNEYCKLAWRREHKELNNLNHWQFADCKGSLIDALGIRDIHTGVPLRATFIVNPDNLISHVSVNPISAGRNPIDILKTLDILQVSY